MTVAVRPPAVAGSFYPDDPAVLRADLERMLADAAADATAAPGVDPATPDPAAPAPPRAPSRALVLPHAGYVYSGPVAAVGYRLVADAVAGAGADAGGAVRRIAVIGPAHRVPVRGVAEAGVRCFATPLGDVEVPADLLATLRARLADTHPDLVVTSPGVHAREHSVEVHLPFLQVVAPGVPVLPLVAGDASPEEMGALVGALLAEEDVLVVVSSDLSHFLPDAEARRVDADTLARAVRTEGPLPPRRACGAVPWNGLTHHAAAHGLRATVLAHATSADSPYGSADRVVGYPAVRYDPVGPTLPGYARAVLAHHLGAGPNPADQPGWRTLLDHPWLRRAGACFVTLRRGDRLRGCIGTVDPYRALGADVAGNAIAAATRDHRFDPVTVDELPGLRVEVSVLSPRTPTTARDLRPGTDGVVLAGTGPDGRPRRATFLPQVWESLPDTGEFLAALRHKAGVVDGSGPWDGAGPEGDDDEDLSRFTVDAWEEDP